MSAQLLPPVTMPQLSGGRERARDLAAPLVPRMRNAIVQLDCRDLVAGTASFADEIILQVFEKGHAQRLVVAYAGGDFADYLLEAASDHGHRDDIEFT
jgi:hypothetical protein